MSGCLHVSNSEQGQAVNAEHLPVHTITANHFGTFVKQVKYN